MAGREFGPPPTIVTEFNEIWRNWLYLLFQKVYQRTSYLFLQVIDGIGDGQPSNTMQEGLIGIAPVALADPSRRTNRNFSSFVPDDWVTGSDLVFAVTFANVQAQSGSQSVVTEINYRVTKVGDDLSAAGTSIFLTSVLPTNVAANTLHSAEITITPAATTTPGAPFQFELARNGQDGADTAAGDMGYKDIAINYTAFINPR